MPPATPLCPPLLPRLLPQAKLQRAEALAEERQALTAHLRATLLSNELKFKQALEKARARGSTELPPELLEMMAQLEGCGLDSSYASSTCSTPGQVRL